MSILQYFSPQALYDQADRDIINAPGFFGRNTRSSINKFLKQAEGRAIRRGNAAATAQQVMTAPGQYYIAGRENFGVQPEVSLAGMSGFGSSAMGFADGGVAGLFQRYADGGAVSGISEEELAAMRQKVMNDYGFDPVDVAKEEGVDPELYLRVMWTENRGSQGPRSEAGAIGLMQLMPATARELGVDPNNPIDNARGGARYLRRMMDQFGTVPLALAAYNAGPGNVRKYGGVPPFEETLNYVAQIHGVDRDPPPLPRRRPDPPPLPRRRPDPPPLPRRRPDDLGTVSYTPPDMDFRANSEYLMAGIGNIFAQPMEEEAITRPYILNIMQQQPKGPEAQRGIDFYRQYAPLATLYEQSTSK